MVERVADRPKIKPAGKNASRIHAEKNITLFKTLMDIFRFENAENIMDILVNGAKCVGLPRINPRWKNKSGIDEKL